MKTNVLARRHGSDVPLQADLQNGVVFALEICSSFVL
jgi:hypothetical protein